MSTEYTFFYEANKKNGYLSIWYDSSFLVPCEGLWDGVWFQSVGQYMMYNKALHFDDMESAELVFRVPQAHPDVLNYDSYEWDRVKSRIVLEGNLYKFVQNKVLRDMLLSTNSSIIVMANQHDTTSWGIGFAEHDALSNRHLWNENLLGNMLVNVRKLISDQSIIERYGCTTHIGFCD